MDYTSIPMRLITSNYRFITNRNGLLTRQIIVWLIIIPMIMSLFACQPVYLPDPAISVFINADNMRQETRFPTGSTVQDVLDKSGISLGNLDRVDPPTYVVIFEGMEISITRVNEEFTTSRRMIPFESQTLLNESMPYDQKRLIQAGKNGEEEITTRILYENGIKVSQADLSPIVIQSPVDEIIMVGVNNPFSIINFDGRLVYLTSGNAWIMDGSTSSRRPLVTSGDLDGRVFTLSPDGLWLLYSRRSSRPLDQEINTLWVTKLTEPNEPPINLRISNVIHFASWRPGEEYTITYSTVEPRSTAPGWQANNDLYFLPFFPEDENEFKPVQILGPSSGGIFGWWGTTFAWSPDGEYLAYSRPDSIGLVNIDNSDYFKLVDILPFNTHAEWAWLPAITWGSNSQVLYFVNHSGSTGVTNTEESQVFDLDAYSLNSQFTAILSSNTGMFSYPSVSTSNSFSNGSNFMVAFMQAIFPLQSATSRYRLTIIDQDGSEPRILYPPDNQIGIEPQTPMWGPKNGDGLVAILNNGNIWIIDISSGTSQQVTGDGSTSRMDWK